MIGFDPETCTWSTATGGRLIAVPQVAGEFSVAETDLAHAARDFGNQVRLRPAAVLRPGSAADVAAIVRFGRRCGLPVVPRGGGHSVDGQAQVRDGIVVDLATLVKVRAVGSDRVSVDGGTSWREVLAATLPVHLAPPVLPDYLDLTVGGTLSAGGIGGGSHRYGCQADNVHELDVVTPEGDLVTCSATQDAGLFDAVRATQGEYGIITRATIALIPVPGTARRYQLAYHDVGAFLADQRRLVGDQRFDHLLGLPRYVDNVGWRYLLEAVKLFDPPDEPDDEALLADLTDDRAALEVTTVSYAEFLGRVDALEAQLRELGSWQRDPHPRCNLLLPGRHAEAFLAWVFAGLGPQDIGLGGGILLYLIPTARFGTPHMPRPDDDTTVVFSLLRTAPPDDPETLARMRRDNETLRVAVRRLGGASYAYRSAHHDANHKVPEGHPARVADRAGRASPAKVETGSRRR